MSIFIELPVVVTHTRSDGINKSVTSGPQVTIVNVENIELATAHALDGHTWVRFRSGKEETIAAPYEQMIDLLRPITLED